VLLDGTEYVSAKDLIKPFPFPYHMVNNYAFLVRPIWLVYIVIIIHEIKVNMPFIALYYVQGIYKENAEDLLVSETSHRAK
jgi:hypothetical protein